MAPESVTQKAPDIVAEGLSTASSYIAGYAYLSTTSGRLTA